jgi:hypothetical protein
MTKLTRDDYAYLKPGMVIGTTNTASPLAAVIRGTTRGIRHTFDGSTASHVLMVCEHHGLLYGMEMTWPKIRRVDLNDIGHICFIAKHPQLDLADMSDRANHWLWESHSRRVKYDLKGLTEFWGIGDDCKKKMYCSEMYREMLKHLKMAYPKHWDKKVSPWDVQRLNTHINYI